VGRDLSPAEVKELLGAYALGALDDDEREQVERLVLTDQDARAELHALQLGAAWLARSDLRPAPRVWEAIQSQMGAGAPASLEDRRRRRSGPRRLVAFAAAAVVAVGVVVGVATLTGDSGTPSVETAAQAALRDPGTTRFDLRAPDGTVAGRLAVYPDGEGYFLDRSLPALGERRTYQLWAIADDGPVSAAVLGPSPRAAEIRAGADTTKYAITVERKGGNARPTGAFVASTGDAVAQ
jgi:anti-sigma-K factor RskA